MKKIILLLFALITTIFNHSVQAKVLSENYLENVVQVNLKNGQEFIMCLRPPITDSQIPDLPKNNPPNQEQIQIIDTKNFPIPPEEHDLYIKPHEDNEPEESSPPAMLNSESQKNQEDNCLEKHSLILADLEYVYLDGKKNLVDRLFIFDEKLYRPDGAGMEYYPDAQNQIQAQYIHELHLTDPNLPNGQKATGGNMSISYDKENPQKYELPLAGISEPFLAGEINGIILNLEGKTYDMKKKVKEINNITLLNIIRPTLTPTPTTSFSFDLEGGYKKYTNLKHGFSLIYPDNLRYKEYEEPLSDDDKYFSLYFYPKETQDNTKYEYYLSKNFLGGWGGPLKDESLGQVNVDGQTAEVKIILGCIVLTPGADPEDPINCIKDVSPVNYGSAFLYTEFERKGDRWYFFGPNWNKGEREINEEAKKFTQILSSFKFDK